ncbi:extracellular solute-binding protein [Carnimonas bestiolae]|uniref:extracellular solute-binding protein n=1 Tax=Carnimonas bestiolae TaxID=3402172 RepID=UPI003EDBDE6D
MRAALLTVCLLIFIGDTQPSVAAATAQLSDDTSPAVATQRGIALFGKPQLGANARHYDYVNPDAPKGGTLRRQSPMALGHFDSTNPFIVGVNPAPGVTYLYRSALYDTLLDFPADEPFTGYPLIASGIRLAPDRSWVEFGINPRARFSDNTPITARDVVFSYRMLMEKGLPLYRGYYAGVGGVSIPRKGVVRFALDKSAPREQPLLLGQFPIFPEHYWRKRDFSRPTFDIPVGSGPYRMAQVEKGARVVYRRNPDYWAKDLLANRGRFNFDTLIYDTYTDDAVALQAFLSGRLDMRIENSPTVWSSGYNGVALERGDIIKFHLIDGTPGNFMGYAMNLRRPLFRDRRVREALTLAFDFKSTNRLLFHGFYHPLAGFWSDSEMQAKGLPSGTEFELLKPFAKHLPSDVFKRPLESDDGLTQSQRLEKALRLLEAAGFQLKHYTLVDQHEHPVVISLLLNSQHQVRPALAYARELKKLGIALDIQVVDPALYQVRTGRFDFDMADVNGALAQSNSPGAEQDRMWGSSGADIPHAGNLAGIKSKPIDAVIKDVINGQSREQIVTAGRALDRLLRYGYYYMPLYYQRGYYLARWRHVRVPARAPRFGVDLFSWWDEPANPASAPSAKQQEH